MRNRPDRNSDSDHQRAVEEFIQGAEQNPGETGADGADSESKSTSYPWEAPKVREDLKRNYPLRLPEPLYLKLKYVSEETGQSMNQLCNDAVRALIEQKVEDLTQS